MEHASEGASIRLATAADCAAIDAIYRHYVLTSTCTFQEEPDDEEARAAWFAVHGERHPVTVIEAAGEVLGWASLSPWKDRSGYRFTCELSVYPRDDARGRGFGRRLLADLLARATALGYHSILGGISGDQAASIGLHESMGFTRVAHFRETGFKFGRWLDVVYYQRRLGSA
jgi:phosphinothricin acetyltransferase